MVAGHSVHLVVLTECYTHRRFCYRDINFSVIRSTGTPAVSCSQFISSA